MRGSWWSRPVAAFIALWFTLSTIQPALVHTCDMHDAPAASATAHAGHHAVSTAADATEAPAPSDDHATCSCPGKCCPTAAATLAVPLQAPQPPVLTDARVAIASRTHVVVATAYVLPFANGPPQG